VEPQPVLPLVPYFINMDRRPLSLEVLTSLFSLQKGNMRSLRLYRVSRVCLIVPLFGFLVVVNNFFLFLDHLFFFRFRRQSIDSPVFIASPPRTGTTYLFHGMSDLERHFSTIKLWELLLAPSIIQKLIILGMARVDRVFGGGGKKAWSFVERIFFKPILNVHLTGMNHPEEDELMLLWSFETAYFSLFYPDSDVARDLLRFDQEVSPRRKNRIMKRYKRLVQRHMYVFSKKSTKRFVSKNPFMISKLSSIKHHFPNALIITINRCPSSSVPSTVALNRALTGISSDILMPTKVESEVVDLMVDWYSYINHCLVKEKILPHLEVDFTDLITHREDVINQALVFLGLEKTLENKTSVEIETTHTTPAKYHKLEGDERAKLFERLPFLKPQ
jgi:hypothetical protein